MLFLKFQDVVIRFFISFFELIHLYYWKLFRMTASWERPMAMESINIHRHTHICSHSIIVMMMREFVVVEWRLALQVEGKTMHQQQQKKNDGIIQTLQHFIVNRTLFCSHSHVSLSHACPTARFWSWHHSHSCVCVCTRGPFFVCLVCIHSLHCFSSICSLHSLYTCRHAICAPPQQPLCIMKNWTQWLHRMPELRSLLFASKRSNSFRN